MNLLSVLWMMWSMPHTEENFNYFGSSKGRRYITSLTDLKIYPLKELGRIYIQRWEIEMCYREIKSDLQDGMHLRSK